MAAMAPSRRLAVAPANCSALAQGEAFIDGIEAGELPAGGSAPASP
jgi:hypothetical protein